MTSNKINKYTVEQGKKWSWDDDGVLRLSMATIKKSVGGSDTDDDLNCAGAGNKATYGNF